jgi:hypothetical protein
MAWHHEHRNVLLLVLVSVAVVFTLFLFGVPLF